MNDILDPAPAAIGHNSVGGIAVHSSADLDSAMKGRRPGDHVSVRWLYAGGGSHQATVTLSPGPPA